jgi:hypothetical protein
LCGTGAPRINHKQLCAIVNALEHMVKKDRVRFPRVGAPKQNHVGIFRFAIRTCSAARSKDRRQTGDARGMSSSVATIDVVSPHYGADKFLCCVVQLVRGLGAAEHAEISRIVPGNGFPESRGNAAQGLVPCGRSMVAVVAYQWLRKAGFHWLKHKTNKNISRKS